MRVVGATRFGAGAERGNAVRPSDAGAPVVDGAIVAGLVMCRNGRGRWCPARRWLVDDAAMAFGVGVRPVHVPVAPMSALAALPGQCLAKLRR